MCAVKGCGVAGGEGFCCFLIIGIELVMFTNSSNCRQFYLGHFYRSLKLFGGADRKCSERATTNSVNEL